MPKYVFVDETKERGYLITAAAFLPGDITMARRVMRGQVMPGQRRTHFTKESNARRKQILDVISGLNPEVRIYDASSVSRRKQREACLEGLVEDLMACDARLLVLEKDESIEELDKRLLYRRVRELGCSETLEYRHLRAQEEPLLAIPDAIAWCWHRGGHWKTYVKEMVVSVRQV